MARIRCRPGNVVVFRGEGITWGKSSESLIMRAVLRNPGCSYSIKRTANIDTVTEKDAGEILRKLPETPTRVIIFAHR